VLRNGRDVNETFLWLKDDAEEWALEIERRIDRASRLARS
jgi:hypothetical protein